MENLSEIRREMRSGGERPSLSYGMMGQITSDLRDELARKGLPGFRKGGRVKRTGIYRLHAGERVIPARGRRRGRR